MCDVTMERNITGVMVYYYVICKRKLWYFAHNILMEQTNESVQIGKIIDEEYYKRDDKHINIDNVINIDFVKNKKVLHEVKKSKRIEDASIMQVKYYLYYLRKKGVVLKAQIDYPLLKQTMKVEINEEDVKIIEEILLHIEEILERDKPPECIGKNYCKSCAYYDLCFI